jgi:hypothetical protein
MPARRSDFGKVAYLTREDAEAEVWRLRIEQVDGYRRLQSYFSPETGSWHVGHRKRSHSI